MNEQEMKQVQDLVDYLKKDERLRNECWASLTYWNRGVGVSLRRYKLYSEHLRISNNLIDFYIYIDLSNGLTVFNELVEKMPALVESVKRRYPSMVIEYAGEPAKDPKTKEMKGSMVMAHFYIPLGNTEVLREVYVAVYNACISVTKGKEVRLRGSQEYKDEVVAQEDLLSEKVQDAAISELHLRPIPREIEYPSGIKQPSEIGGVVSWVTSIGALFDRKEIVLSDGRMMRPGNYIIPPYQRKYTWSYDNVSQLCRDLLRSADDGKETYHLGTIILHHQPGGQGDVFYVVDGQQRLTTISYLIQSEIFSVDTASPKIRKSDINNILSALEEYQEDKERILEQLKRSTIVVIAVNEINEAFQLFSTQNGRGRPLTPANLLKAYHLHELEESVDAAEKDRIWEANNAEQTRDGRLLSQVLGEHLYRLRCWSRGDFPKEQFSNAKIKEFKGITFNTGSAVGVPAQNMMKLRQCATHGGVDYYSRSMNDGMNPLAMIDQPIVNGGDFFSYIESYAEAYRVLFGFNANEDLLGFRGFYESNCTYRQSGRRGDTYARHIFESLCLFCYDRFGAKGLCACERYLYRCAYYERAVKLRCYYSTCGATFAIRAVRAMVACMTLADVKDRLHALNGDVLESYRKEKKVFAGKPVPEGIALVRSVFDN